MVTSPLRSLPLSIHSQLLPGAADTIEACMANIAHPHARIYFRIVLNMYAVYRYFFNSKFCSPSLFGYNLGNL